MKCDYHDYLLTASPIWTVFLTNSSRKQDAQIFRRLYGFWIVRQNKRINGCIRSLTSVWYLIYFELNHRSGVTLSTLNICVCRQLPARWPDAATVWWLRVTDSSSCLWRPRSPLACAARQWGRLLLFLSAGWLLDETLSNSTCSCWRNHTQGSSSWGPSASNILLLCVQRLNRTCWVLKAWKQKRAVIRRPWDHNVINVRRILIGCSLPSV